MLPALAPLSPAQGRADPRPLAPRPGFLRRGLTLARTIAEVLAEARELRRALGRRYPFVDF